MPQNPAVSAAAHRPMMMSILRLAGADAKRRKLMTIPRSVRARLVAARPPRLTMIRPNNLPAARLRVVLRPPRMRTLRTMPARTPILRAAPGLR